MRVYMTIFLYTILWTCFGWENELKTTDLSFLHRRGDTPQSQGRGRPRGQSRDSGRGRGRGRGRTQESSSKRLKVSHTSSQGDPANLGPAAIDDTGSPRANPGSPRAGPLSPRPSSPLARADSSPVRASSRLLQSQERASANADARPPSPIMESSLPVANSPPGRMSPPPARVGSLPARANSPLARAGSRLLQTTEREPANADARQSSPRANTLVLASAFGPTRLLVHNENGMKLADVEKGKTASFTTTGGRIDAWAGPHHSTGLGNDPEKVSARLVAIGKTATGRVRPASGGTGSIGTMSLSGPQTQIARDREIKEVWNPSVNGGTGTVFGEVTQGGELEVVAHP